MRSVIIANKTYPVCYRLIDDGKPMERALGCTLGACVKDPTIEQAAILIWGGLKHDTKLKLTPGMVEQMLQSHIELGGNVPEILFPCIVEMFRGGLLGAVYNMAEIERVWAVRPKEDEDVTEGKAQG